MGNDDKKEPDYEILTEEKDSFSVLPPPSKIPFFNSDKRNKKRIDTYTEVVKSANNLIEALSSHAKVKGRFKNINIEIETDQIEVLNKLEEAKQKKEILEKTKKLNLLSLDIEIAEKEEKLSAMKTSQKKSPEDQRKEKLKRIIEDRNFQAELAAFSATNIVGKRKAIKKAFSPFKEEILNGKERDQLSKEALDELEDLEDAEQYAIDNL